MPPAAASASAAAGSEVSIQRPLQRAQCIVRPARSMVGGTS